jgi:hypothetical protein
MRPDQVLSARSIDDALDSNNQERLVRPYFEQPKPASVGFRPPAGLGREAKNLDARPERIGVERRDLYYPTYAEVADDAPDACVAAVGFSRRSRR